MRILAHFLRTNSRFFRLEMLAVIASSRCNNRLFVLKRGWDFHRVCGRRITGGGPPRFVHFQVRKGEGPPFDRLRAGSGQALGHQRIWDDSSPIGARPPAGEMSPSFCMEQGLTCSCSYGNSGTAPVKGFVVSQPFTDGVRKDGAPGS